ncbi:MAG: nickel-responsive transcriptional regulator NikR [Candidatus Altiarchaeota archaeon]
MDRAVRFGVSLPRSLVKNFDKVLREIGYDNRSKAIQDAITEFLKEKKIRSGKEAVIGTISYLYDHHTSGVGEKIVSVQHDFGEGIKSMMHAHISHHSCVEVLIVAGKAAEVEKLAGNISAIRGVENCKHAVLKTSI